MSKILFDRQPLFQLLDRLAAGCCTGQLRVLRGLCDTRLSIAAHGKMPQWMAAWDQLPPAEGTSWNASGAAVVVTGSEAVDMQALKKQLMQFHPWRKGPFELFGVPIDTEWRSNWKWDRVAGAVDFRNRRVLDVGCGNGYYGWKMQAAGAELVVGCDPFPLYCMQFEVLRRYAPTDASGTESHFVLPLGDDDLPLENSLAWSLFDITLSMGVLYHRPSPLEHLQRLRHTLVAGGKLVLETLVIDSAKVEALWPTGRYAKMKNVGAIPSIPQLEQWLQQAGFAKVQLVDICRTTVDEQRSTEWMTFESLADFLDPHDPSLTIEGYPAPLRAIVIAEVL